MKVEVHCKECGGNADWLIPCCKRAWAFLRGRYCTHCGSRFLVNRRQNFYTLTE